MSEQKYTRDGFSSSNLDKGLSSSNLAAGLKPAPKPTEPPPPTPPPASDFKPNTPNK